MYKEETVAGTSLCFSTGVVSSTSTSSSSSAANKKNDFTGTCTCYVPSFLKTAQPCLYTHVAASGSINSERRTTKPAREGFVSTCACTEPVRTGINAVRVEYGRPKWPITMLNYTHTYLVQKNVLFFIRAKRVSN